MGNKQGYSTQASREADFFNRWQLIAALLTVLFSGLCGAMGAGYKYRGLEDRVANLETLVQSKLDLVNLKLDDAEKRQDLIVQHLRELINAKENREGK